jgi:DNA-binding transcriptional ArsR family regulator
MTVDPKLAEVAAMLADPTRARLLVALMDGRAHPAKELAFLAGVSASTASAHLKRLLDMRLVAVSARGRYRDYRIASEPVCRMIEAVGAVAAEVTTPRRRLRSGDEALRAARLCYDHIAGRLGVALADALQDAGNLVLTDEGGEVTPAGDRFLAGFGVDLAGARRARRIFCRPCLDWTERRSHLAGAVGAALSARLLALGWVARMPDTRALTIAGSGREGLTRTFGLDLSHIAPTAD